MILVTHTSFGLEPVDTSPVPKRFGCRWIDVGLGLLQLGFVSGTRGFSVMRTWRPHTNTGVRGNCYHHALLQHSTRLCSGVMHVFLPLGLSRSLLSPEFRELMVTQVENKGLALRWLAALEEAEAYFHAGGDTPACRAAVRQWADGVCAEIRVPS